jgi:isopenicillin N synthase-like dioxygenase
LLAGHGLDSGAARDVLELAACFFALPQDELAAIDMIHSPYFRGYSPVGSERTQGRPDLREQLDVGPEGAPHAWTPGEAPYLRLHGPNLWPVALPQLRPATLGWMDALRGVAARLLGAVTDVAGLPRETFASGFERGPHERLKIIRYPGAEHSSSRQGVGEHRDSGFVTLIVQDGTGGLQVDDGNGFADVRAADGQLIVVLGRTFAAATGGFVNAAAHRVVSPPAGRRRISIAYFYNPRLDYAVTPLSDLAEPRTEYGYEVLEVVLRSHPHVAERYFADLIA